MQKLSFWSIIQFVYFASMLVAFSSEVSFAQEAVLESHKLNTDPVQRDRRETYYQYSIWGAFVNKVFEGDLTTGELKKRGDVGLGSFTKLDGEMVMLDGIPYRIEESGIVTVPKDEDLIVYANAAFFDEDFKFTIPEVSNFEMFRQIIGERLPSRNYFYSFKITGNFFAMKCGGLAKQEPPFDKGLDVLIPNRPVFNRENFSGTIVGFFCPSFIGDINVAGFHCHFLSDDKTFGGHVMEFSAKDLVVSIDQMSQYNFELPTSKPFEQVQFDKSFQYKQK